MDRAVKRIRPSNFELSQIQDNLANPLQQVLDRLSGDEDSSGTSALLPVLEQRNPSSTALSVKIPALFVGGREDGPYKINQPTIIFGTPSARNAQGGLDAQKDSELFSYGQIVAFGSKVNSDGFVLIPQTDGPAFRVAPNNSFTAFQINFDGSAGCTGPFNAASVSSASGFKSWLPPAHYWNLSYPGGLVPLVVAIAQAANGTASTTPWGITMPRAGSITGISATQTGVTNTVCAVYIYRNGTLVYSANVTNGQASGAIAIAKGTVPFVAADALSARVLYSQNGINVCTQVAIEVEEVA